ncbi:hypothetical protein DPMN_055242 [Dreissena polymorpha]|uniref:Uncharacterized protein n=1 Tax=Dreissena polymorpha TaxID=45954 RepID=A0A9D4CS70_DREPO|nr:hypothetical protein DPMN_055242 [Dreissena polymorpha]
MSFLQNGTKSVKEARINETSRRSSISGSFSHPEGSAERDNAFDIIRKDGIYRYNKEQATLPELDYMSERKGQADVQCQNATASLEIACFTDKESYAEATTSMFQE